MTIGFLNFLYKITKIRHFWLKIPKSSIFGLKLRHFLFFSKTLQLGKFEEVHFKYGSSFLKFQSQNTHLRNFLSEIQVFLFFYKQNFFLLDIFEDADFKHDNISLKLLPKNTEVRHFQSQFQVFLLLCKILQVDKFERADFKYKNSLS